MVNFFVLVYNSEIFVRKILFFEWFGNWIFFGFWKNIYKIIDNSFCYVKKNRKSVLFIGIGR